MPVVSQGRLFHFDRHGNRARLTCMKSETGEELWRSEYSTGYEDYYDFSDGPRASPLVGRSKPSAHARVVVLPEPFGPSKPYT